MIVAIEGASSDLSLAVARPDGGTLAQAAWSSQQRQSAELLPRLLALLDEQHVGLDAISAIAVGTGPGSFTGLRVAMSLAKGLCLALDLAIVGYPSLDAWLEAESHALAAVSRAGAREAHLRIRGERDVRILAADALHAAVGEAPIVAPGELAAAFGLAAATGPHGAAAAIARHAADRLATDPRGDELETLEPRYLRPPRGLPADEPGEVRWL